MILYCIIAYFFVGFVVAVLIATLDAIRGCVRPGDGSLPCLFLWPIFVLFLVSEYFDKLINIIVKNILYNYKKGNKMGPRYKQVDYGSHSKWEMRDDGDWEDVDCGDHTRFERIRPDDDEDDGMIPDMWEY